MVEQIIYGTKIIILIEAVTHAVRCWGILDVPRQAITTRSRFVAALLSCYECTAIWVTAFIFLYINFFEIRFLTFVLVFQRLSCYLRVAWEILDVTRALKINKL